MEQTASAAQVFSPRNTFHRRFDLHFLAEPLYGWAAGGRGPKDSDIFHFVSNRDAPAIREVTAIPSKQVVVVLVFEEEPPYALHGQDDKAFRAGLIAVPIAPVSSVRLPCF